MRARPPGGYSQLLPHEGAAGSGRSRERKHQVTATTRSGLQECALSAPEGAADGGNQDGIHHSPASTLKYALHTLLSQNRKRISTSRPLAKRIVSTYPRARSAPAP